MKTITFFKQGHGRRQLVDLPVDLDSLSGLALALATNIRTTENADDLSHVTLRCKYTNKALFEKVLTDDSGRYTSTEKANAKQHLKNINEGDLFDEADFVQATSYIWDALRDGESPEDYFRRHAGYIETEAFPYLKDTYVEA